MEYKGEVDMIGQLLARRYQILRVLGAGAFGQTYVAQDTHIPGNPTCVVKHLKPASNSPKLLETARQLFQREAETLVKLGKHEQIPQLLAYFEEDQEFYLVQEFIEGHTLTTELPPGQHLPESQVIQLLEEILNILEFVHSEGVIHRDIKPDNIMRRQSDNKLVLIDFGAIKQVQTQPLSTAGQEQSVATSTRIGTPGYSPTEQDRGKPRPSSDIYALGMVGIQALTGVYPHQFQEDDETGELLWQHLTQVSPGVAAILTKMARYHFKDRYQSATQALQALQQLKNSSSTVQGTVVDQVTHGVHELLLRWVERGKIKTQVIRSNQPSKNPGTVRIGRDPAVCDIVLSEPTVSGLHVEIFFNRDEKHFYLRSLQQSNPPVVDGQPLPTGEVVLQPRSNVRLGQMSLRVLTIDLKPLTETREYTPQKKAMQQASTSAQPIAPSVQPPAVQTARPNTNSSSSYNQTLRPVSTRTTGFSSTSNNSLPLLMRLGVAALLSVGGGYAYLQWQSSNPGITTTSTAKSDSTVNSNSTNLSTAKSGRTGTSTAKSDLTVNSDGTGTSTAKSDSTEALSEYGSILLANARQKASGGDFQGAIAQAEQISTSSSVYQEAQNELAQWQGQQKQKLAGQQAKNQVRRRLDNATDVAKRGGDTDRESAIKIAPEAIAQRAAPQSIVPKGQREAIAQREAPQASAEAPPDTNTTVSREPKSANAAIAAAPQAIAQRAAPQAIAQSQKEATAKQKPEVVAITYTCSCQPNEPDAQKTVTSKESGSDLTGSSCAANGDPEAKVMGVWKCNQK